MELYLHKIITKIGRLLFIFIILQLLSYNLVEEKGSLMTYIITILIIIIMYISFDGYSDNNIIILIIT